MFVLNGIYENEHRLRVKYAIELSDDDSNIDEYTGVVVDSIMPCDTRMGKSYKFYVNPKTKEQWYEEKSRNYTPEELKKVGGFNG